MFFGAEAILVNEYSIALKINDVVQGHNFMRLFHFTIALAATLTGCSTCLAPQQASQMDSKTVVITEKPIAVKKEKAIAVQEEPSTPQAPCPHQNSAVHHHCEGGDAATTR